MVCNDKGNMGLPQYAAPAPETLQEAALTIIEPTLAEMAGRMAMPTFNAYQYAKWFDDDHCLAHEMRDATVLGEPLQLTYGIFRHDSPRRGTWGYLAETAERSIIVTAGTIAIVGTEPRRGAPAWGDTIAAISDDIENAFDAIPVRARTKPVVKVHFDKVIAVEFGAVDYASRFLVAKSFIAPDETSDVLAEYTDTNSKGAEINGDSYLKLLEYFTRYTKRTATNSATVLTFSRTD